jgi:ribokinase
MNNENYKYDFVALGDITIDAFIKLSDVHIHDDFHEGKRIEEICFRFGDKIEYDNMKEVVSVGNSPNASVSASRLGLKSALITDLGCDENGEKCIKALEESGVNTDFVRKHQEAPTNYHYVLRYKAERTILVKHNVYEYSLPNLPPIKWLYLSSLGENSLPYHAKIALWLQEHPETKLAFQPGTFQIKQGADKLKDLYKLSHLFFCNVQEAQRILGTNEKDIKKLLEGMRELGVKIPVITDGPDGAYFFDGEEGWHMPIYPDIAEPVDRTGAGDSFASTFTSFLAMGLPTSEALRRAPINSMSVVQYIGAQEGLLSKKMLEQYLENAPVDYKATKIM